MDKNTLFMLDIESYIKERLKLSKDALRVILRDDERDYSFIILLWEKQYFEYHALRKGALRKAGEKYSPLP